MGLYERIKEVANRKGYSINRLEKELGFPRSSISKYNKNVPSMEKIQKIADLLNVPLRVNNVFTPFAGIFVTNVLQIEMLVDVRKHQ